jgi:4-amino-4-deoxy-L-arabinose transferase-like glycosyltransferase
VTRAVETSQESTKKPAGLWIAARDHLLYLAIIATYCLPSLFGRDLFFRDESRYGGVVREMIENDTWLTMTNAGQPYLEKPPIFFDLLRLAAEVTGSTEPWVFFGVVALTAFFFVAASDALFRSLGFDRPTTRLANLFMLSVPWFAINMQILRMDLLFGGFILLSVACYARGLARPSSNAWTIAGGVLAGLALLVKGPFGGLMPVLTVAAFHIASRNWRRLLRIDFQASILIAAALIVGWLLVVYLTFGERAIALIFDQQLIERAVEGRDSHNEWWLYLVLLPITLLPWLLLAPVTTARKYRETIFSTHRSIFSVPQSGLWIVVAYLLVSLVLLNIVAQKSVFYFVPVVPALMLPFAIAYRRLELTHPKLFDWFFAGVAIIALLLAVAVVDAFDILSENDRANVLLFIDQPTIIAASGAFALAAIPLAIAGLLRGEARLLGSIVSVIVLVAAFNATILPGLSRAFSPRITAQAFEIHVPADRSIVVYGVDPGTLSYGFQRPLIHVSSVDELHEMLSSFETTYLITTEGRLKKERSLSSLHFERLANSRLESTRLILVKRASEK